MLKPGSLYLCIHPHGRTVNAGYPEGTQSKTWKFLILKVIDFSFETQQITSKKEYLVLTSEEGVVGKLMIFDENNYREMNRQW